MQNNSFNILKRSIKNFSKWEKYDRDPKHVRHGLDPPLLCMNLYLFLKKFVSPILISVLQVLNENKVPIYLTIYNSKRQRFV